jgi:hypothetical protein
MSMETKSITPNERSSPRLSLERHFRLSSVKGSFSQAAENSGRGDGSFSRRLRRVGKACLRPTSLLMVLLVAHLCSRLVLHRTSALSGTHNYDRAYGVSMSLMAGRGFHDIVVDDSPASAPLEEFFELKRTRISREEFDAYLASHPNPARDPYYQRFLELASIRVADVRLVSLLWQIFGIDRQVLATFYSIFSMTTCACLFFIARRLTGSGWAGLAAAALLTASPIEGFLNTWSWRDSSPMWFTAASLAWFVCGLERSRRPAVNCAAYLLLGLLAVAGTGWRVDALLLLPFLAGCVVIRLIILRHGWRYWLAAGGCFLAGAAGARMAITAIGADEAQTANIGYHMAFYGDFPRSKLLGIENSFQVLFSDMQTLDNARHIQQADHPGAESLKYMSPEYCAVCRRMFFEELNYNVYRWVSLFPRFYVQSLAGLDAESVMDEIGSRQIQTGLQSPLRQVFRWEDRLGHAMPYLFLIGVLATACVGRQRLPALLLALFSVYYAGIMFLVLPDQKHLGVLLVPLYVFAGAGIWGIARLFSRGAWGVGSRAEWGRHIWRVAKVVLIAAAAWGLGCVWAHAHSVARREELLNEIRTRVADGVDAPETLRGERNFAVSIRPDSSAAATGYQLTISAGSHPGTLTCRQIYFPRDWAHLWGRELITRHTLYPNREQSFFVSCLQGSRLGDPCPHLCAIAIDGDARIIRSTRVAMSDWDHPQFCTVYYDGQRSAGSPIVRQKPSDWLYVGARPFADASPDKMQTNRSGMTDIMAPVPSPNSAGRPLVHIVAHTSDTGLWKIAMSDGWRFSFADLNYWSPAAKWLQLQSGDFNGDGMFDLVAQAPDGKWWMATANGGYHEFRSIDALPSDERYDFVGVGDFNGDGLDDLILRSTDGHWTLALSTGDGFRCQAIDGLSGGTAPRNVRIGDFLGNGRSQIAGLDRESGRWTIALLDSAKWTVRPWGSFPAGVDWRYLSIGDFCGTGQADVAAWDPKTGDWTVGRNEGERLVAKPFGKWPAGKNFRCVHAGQFGDGRHAGIAAVDVNTAELNVAVSDGAQFTTRQYPGQPALENHFFVGAFSGGPRDELLGIASDGQLWVGKFDATGQLRFETWGRWPDADRLTDFRAAGFLTERQTTP